MQRNPHEAPSLMKYGQIILDLAICGQNWHFYDKNFCHLPFAPNTGKSCSMGTIQSELWLRSQYPVRALQSTHQVNEVPKTGGSSIPLGYCFKYHRRQFCSAVNCAFKHVCFKCQKGAHSASTCNFSSSTRTSKWYAHSDHQAKSPNAGQAQTSS